MATATKTARRNATYEKPEYVVVVTTYIIAIIFVLLIIFDSGLFNVIWYAVPLIIIFTTECVGVVSGLILIFGVHKKKKESGNRMKKETEWLKNWKLFFLWIFATGCGVRGLINISINCKCLIQSGSAIFVGEHIFYGLRYLIWLIFCILQLLLASFYAEIGIPSSGIYHWCIVTMVATNAIHWFHYLLFEMRMQIHESKHDVASFTTDFQLAGKCYLNSSLKVTLDELDPYLVPFNTEFFLLASSFLLHMWVNNDKEAEDEDNEWDTPTENTSLISHDMHVYGEKSDVHTITSKVTLQRKKIYIALITILLIVIALVSLTNLEGQRIGETPVNFTILIACSIFMLTAILTSFFVLRKQCYFKDSGTRYGVSQYIMLLCSFVIVAYDTFCITAVIQVTSSGDDSIRNILSIFVYFCKIINSACLTVLVLQATRCCRLYYTTKTCLNIEHCFILLYFINILYWISYSIPWIYFFGTLNPEDALYGNFWDFIQYTFLPFSAYFRMHVALECLNFYFKFSKNI